MDIYYHTQTHIDHTHTFTFLIIYFAFLSPYHIVFSIFHMGPSAPLTVMVTVVCL